MIKLDDLKAGIFFAMKENLMIQFVYPDYEIPQVYRDVIETIDHSKIQPAVASQANAEVVIFNGWKEMEDHLFHKETAYILRVGKEELCNHCIQVCGILNNVERLNIVLTDMEKLDAIDMQNYQKTLTVLASRLKELYIAGETPQVNILTDRIMLDKMNNCNAGFENLTLAPDGKFYVCPAFYLSSDRYAEGDLQNGLDVKNPQLYQLDHAPLCRRCDAYQCRRCVWLNRKMTLEVNTPSHEQCVTAHLERNASRNLLADILTAGKFLPVKEIKKIDYLDPFDIKENI